MTDSTMTDELHRDIMNLPCKVPGSEPAGDHEAAVWTNGYKRGHRDARHAAAELVAAACQRTEAPATLSLPERRDLRSSHLTSGTYFRGLGWNECLDEIARRAQERREQG